MTHSPLITAAMAFAKDRHAGQTRKDGGTPYVHHLQTVADMVAQFGGDEITIAAAWLHDVVEDCPPTSINEITALLGPDIAALVAEVTDDKSLAKPIRKELQRQNAPHKSPRACLIKVADKIANLNDIADNPPPHWDKARRIAYVDWAVAVVGGLAHVPAAAQELFDTTCITTRAAIERHYS